MLEDGYSKAIWHLFGDNITKRKTNKLKYKYKLKFNYANFPPILFTDLTSARTDMKKGLKHLYNLGLRNIRCTLYRRMEKGLPKWRKVGKFNYSAITVKIYRQRKIIWKRLI